MKIILGIDVGGSTTKIVGFDESKALIGTLQVRATHQITSMYGAIGHFLSVYKMLLKDVSAIVLTGVGASFFEGNIYEIPTYKVDEFQAIGFGGLKLSKLDNALVVSMGTGTAYVIATKDKVVHIGGSGVGGGTLLGLSSKLIDEDDIAIVAKLAEEGNLGNVDLLIKDITDKEIPSLPLNATASNFGKIKNIASDSDFARGLLNMIFQTIGMLSVFACLNSSQKDIVLTGALTTFKQAHEVFDGLGRLHKVNFIIPENAVFATAIGATELHIGKE